MNTTIDNPKVGSFLLISIVVTSTIIATAVGKILPAQFGGGEEWPGYLFLSISILVGAYFLPETTDKKFYSRQSALGGVAFFLWLSIPPIIEPKLGVGLGTVIALLSAFLFYWIALWSIRGVKNDH